MPVVFQLESVELESVEEPEAVEGLESVACGESCGELELPAWPDSVVPPSDPVLVELVELPEVGEEPEVSAPVPALDEPLGEAPLVPLLAPARFVVAGFSRLTASMPVIEVWPSVLVGAELGPLTAPIPVIAG